MEDPLEERRKKIEEGLRAQQKQPEKQGEVPPVTPSSLQSGAPVGNIPKGSGFRPGSADEEDIKAATHFFTDAQKAAQLGDFEQAVALGNIALETLERLKAAGLDRGYYKAYQVSVDSWTKRLEKERDIEKHATEWIGLSEEDIRKDIRKKIEERKKLLMPGGAETPEKKLELLKYQRNLVEGQKRAKGSEGFKGYLTIADDISKIVDEATTLGTQAEADVFDQSKLERAIARLKQAEKLCLDGNEQTPNAYDNQLIEVRALIDRYETDYARAFELFKLSEKPGDPFALNKLKVLRDNQEVKQDHFDTLSQKISEFTRDKDHKKLNGFIRGIEHEYDNDKSAKSVLDNYTLYQNFEHVLYSEEIVDKKGALIQLKKGCKNKEIAKLIDAACKDIDAGKIDKDKYSNDFLSEFVKDATAESERAKRTAGMMAEDRYGKRHTKKRDNRWDVYAGRPLSGHKNWGEGGWGASDAAEWIGFNRNPIETLGNLVATGITVYLVVYKIVGPVLDMFSFYIPFMGILKFPIFLIIIIILHPMLKGILEPIKKDLHFIAKDPYWYEEGTGRDMNDKAEEIKERAKKRLDELKVKSKSQKKIARDNDVDVIN